MIKNDKIINYEDLFLDESDSIEEILKLIKKYKEFNKEFFEKSFFDNVKDLFREVDYIKYVNTLEIILKNSSNLDIFIQTSFSKNKELLDITKSSIITLNNLSEITLNILIELKNKRDGKQSFNYSEFNKIMSMRENYYQLCLEIEEGLIKYKINLYNLMYKDTGEIDFTTLYDNLMNEGKGVRKK